MKKEYEMPTIKVQELEVCDIITASGIIDTPNEEGIYETIVDFVSFFTE